MTSSRVLPGFRTDINGLRAWAVVAVILYHFGIPGVGGGFVGVDVFFVISGFLMTNIVVKGLESGQFSVLAFYGARTRRIVPALLVVCLALLVFGYFFLAPLDYKILSKHALAAIGFYSNFRFRSEAGYFDAVSHEKWLLHTWSLSVEWQFYLLLPVIALVLWRLRPERLTLIIAFVVGALASLTVSVIQTPSAASTAFFLLPARAWEMLAGGLVFLLARVSGTPGKSGVYLEWVGFALVLAAIVLFDSRLGWPGWHALVPVVGAMLILAARRDGSIWTGNKLAQWLGDRSYSLYLWHWPIFVALAYFEVHQQTAWIIVGLIATLICGDLSCRWVENPARRYLGRVTRRRFAVLVTCSALLVAGCAGGITLAGGLSGRFDPLVDQVSNEKKNKDSGVRKCHLVGGVESPSCVWGGGLERVVVIGDSHAEALVTAIAAADGDRAGLVQWTYCGCVYIQGLKIAGPLPMGFDGYNCEGFIDWVTNQLASKPKSLPVILAGRYAASAMGSNVNGVGKKRPGVYFSKQLDETTPAFLEEYKRHMVDTACRLAAERKVYLVRPIPEIGVHVPKALARRLIRGDKEDVLVSLASYRQRNAWIWEAQDEAARRCGAVILDPTVHLCDQEYCYGSRNLFPLYRDDDHLSEYGNKQLVPIFRQVFDDLAKVPVGGRP